MTTTAFQRARSAESKLQRSHSLIAAARSLALENGVASVTLTAIAERAGVHHSAVRRYFASYKDVLLQLAAEGWDRWAAAVSETLRGRQVTPAELADVLASTLAADPLFCDLLANVPLHLEHDVDVQRVIAFKKSSGTAVRTLSWTIAAAVPSLRPAGALDIVTAANALAATLWQVTHPAAALRAALESDPALALVGPGDFEKTLTRLLHATCAGLARQP
jgi:AcrR family transcriptional regulator